jgi:hypothetical protein
MSGLPADMSHCQGPSRGNTGVALGIQVVSIIHLYALSKNILCLMFNKIGAAVDYYVRRGRAALRGRYSLVLVVGTT